MDVGGGREKWLVVGGRGWWGLNYGWSWVVVIKLWLIVGGGGGEIMPVRGWLHDSVMPLFSKTCRTKHCF